MNIRKIWLIVILMSTALIGIIIVQAYWIDNAINLRKTIFDQQVNEAMNRTVSKMETKNTADKLYKRLEATGLQSMQFLQLDSLFSNQNMLSDTLINEVLLSAENSNDKYNLEIKMQASNEFLPSSETPGSDLSRSFTLDPFSFESSVIDIESVEDPRMLPMLMRDVEDQFLLNVNRSMGVLRQLLVEMAQTEYSEEKQIDTRLLDSILHSELKGQGINAPYHYGVLIDQNKLLSTAELEKDRNVILSSDHHVNLYPNSILQKDDQLLLSFPSEEKYVLGSMWTLLSGSLLFTLVIILAFAYTIWVIFRQKKLSDIKTDFINNMTHEFKTPIATINLAVDSMNNAKVINDRNRIKTYTSIIREENKRMNAQVEKVLQIALLDKEKIKLNLQKTNVLEIIQTALETIKLQVENKGGELSCDLEEAKLIISADEVHLVNVLCNLLDNAIKYSEGSPKIHIGTRSTKTDVYISITDHGIGLSNEAQQHIFEKFYRVPKGNVHDVKGFGLGLSYVKAILDAHSGSIDVKSQLNVGSTFTIRFPLDR